MPHSGPGIFEVINNTRGVLLEVFKRQRAKPACKNVPPNRERSYLVFVLSRKTKMSNGWFSSASESLCFNFYYYFFEFQIEMKLIPNGAQISKRNQAHMTFFLLLPTAEGGGEPSSLGASTTADGNNGPGREEHAPPPPLGAP